MMWLIALISTLSVAVVVLAVMTFLRARADRRRSDARVAALAAAIDDTRWTPGLGIGADSDFMPESPAAVSLVVPDVERPSRLPAFAGAALVVVAASTLLFVGMNRGSRAPRETPTPMASSIELLSMRHSLDRETLIVSGLVRNPTTSGTPGLSAVISVLGQDGQVVARGESALDSVVLGPGKETTFRVSVSDVVDPGRYRVAFVNGSQIVPHVDRRSDLARTALANDARGN
jgi:hypothetical protein